MHEPFGGGEHHVHDVTQEATYQLDNVVLTTIGVDVGSSTFHLMFAKIHLCREANRLSTRYEVVSREVIWRSSINLTPYQGRNIDAEAVGEFVVRCHEQAELTPDDVDSGAVILTGEALRHENARALGEQIAAGSGKFVCVSAGHHLEAMLAAFGSGATTYSSQFNKRILHVDVGGGTTKLSFIEDGHVRSSAALMIGGRQIAWNEHREIVSTTAGARSIARHAGVDISIGSVLTKEAEAAFVTSQAEVILDVMRGIGNKLERSLRLTRILPKTMTPEVVTFSGGVSEYIYGRSDQEYGDLGRSLGRAITFGLANDTGHVPVADPGEGIRATVAGASQCSVQLSGNTVTVSDPTILPIRNIPVIHPGVVPTLSGGFYEPNEVTRAITKAVTSLGFTNTDPIALAIDWTGDPSYGRMASLAKGIENAFNQPVDAPVLIMLDADIAASIGHLLVTEFPVARPLICLDGLEPSPLDYVDVGAVLEPSGVLPVVIKSLLFESNDDRLVVASP